MRIYLALLLAAIIFAAYSISLYSPFVFDDDHFVIGNPSVNFHAPISLHRNRALTLTTYRINYLFGQENPVGYHLVNVLVHCLNAALVFFFLLPIIGELPAFLACGIFALHPLQSEAVTYISGRPELLMTCFTLLALCCTRALMHGWPRSPKAWTVAIAFSCLFAIMSKESGIVSIPLVLGYLWLNKRISQTVAFFCMIGAGFVGILLIANSTLIDSGRPFYEHVLIQNVQLWHYLTMLVYPASLSIDHDPSSIPFALQLIAVAATIVASSAMCRRRSGIVGLCGAWTAICLAPRFMLNIPETLAEHQMMLPMVGLSALLALGINHLFEGVYGERERTTPARV